MARVTLTEGQASAAVLLLLEAAERLEAEGQASMAAEVLDGIVPALMDVAEPAVRLEARAALAEWRERIALPAA